MGAKEGDDKGLEPIRDRLKTDEDLIRKAFELHGVLKVLLRNSLPVDKAKEYVDAYEITPEFYYELKDQKPITLQKPWQVKDDDGVPSYSLLAAPVVVALIKQLAEVLDA